MYMSDLKISFLIEGPFALQVIVTAGSQSDLND